MEPIIVAIVMAAIVFVGVYLMVAYPATRRIFGFTKWAADITRMTVDYWGFRKHSKKINLTFHYINLVRTLSLEGTDLRKARKQVAEYIREAHAKFYPDMENSDDAVRAAMAGYMLLLSHEEIRDTINSLKDHKSIEVKKATYVAIDVLGEFFDLRDKLSQEYFQHLIYGLNKVLVQLKKDGVGKRNLKKVAATLWRVYKITKAYRKLQSSKDLTEEEFYAKVDSTFSSLFRMLGI